MRIWIASFVLCICAHAQAATVDAMPGMPASYERTENMQLLQSSPAMDANSLVAPVASDANTLAAPIETAQAVEGTAPRIQGSVQFRAPGAGSTLSEISYTNATSTDHMRVYPSSIDMTDPMYLDNNMEATEYSFRFTHGLSDESALFLDAGFLNSKMDLVTYGSTTRRGVRDFEFGYLGRNPTGRGAYIYGASIAGSPESLAKDPTNMGGFSGATTLRAHGGYERRISKALAGAHFALKEEFGNRSNYYYYGQYRSKKELSADMFAYYEFPVMKQVTFGVSGGIDTDGNPLAEGTNTYHASAYGAVEMIEQTQLKIQAEGASTYINTDDSGTNTKVMGILSKAL